MGTDVGEPGNNDIDDTLEKNPKRYKVLYPSHPNKAGGKDGSGDGNDGSGQTSATSEALIFWREKIAREVLEDDESTKAQTQSSNRENDSTNSELEKTYAYTEEVQQVREREENSFYLWFFYAFHLIYCFCIIYTMVCLFHVDNILHEKISSSRRKKQITRIIMKIAPEKVNQQTIMITIMITIKITITITITITTMITVMITIIVTITATVMVTIMIMITMTIAMAMKIPTKM